MALNAFKFLFSRDKFFPVLRQGKVLANDAIYSAAATHPRVGFFTRDTLGRRSKFKLENGNEALKFGEKLFVTQLWDRGYVFTRPYFENRYPEVGGYNWGGCGLVAQSIKGERALYYGNTVYGIIASHKNSLSHALVEPKEVRKEWQNKSPEDPVSAENLNEQARAKDYDELNERRVHRQNVKDEELRSTRGFGRYFSNS